MSLNNGIRWNIPLEFRYEFEVVRVTKKGTIRLNIRAARTRTTATRTRAEVLLFLHRIRARREREDGIPTTNPRRGPSRSKIVLVRVDHNVTMIESKKGDGLTVISDAFRVESSIPTLYAIIERGGRPILMTHVNRPRDKKTKKITMMRKETGPRRLRDI